MSPRLVLTVPAGNPERRMWMIHIYLPGDSAAAVDSFVLKSELQEHWRCPCHRHLKLLKGFFLPSNWRTFFFFCYFFSPPPLFLQQAGLKLSWGWPWVAEPPASMPECWDYRYLPDTQIMAGTQDSLQVRQAPSWLTCDNGLWTILDKSFLSFFLA